MKEFTFVSPFVASRCSSRSLRTGGRIQICAKVSSPTANILVVAANRGLGAHLSAALGDTENLHTTHRPCSATSSEQEQASTTHALDALDASAAEALFSSLKPRTVVSCIGGKAGAAELPDYEGNKNLIKAARQAKVRRFVLISALGAGNSEGSVPFQVMDTLRPILLEKSRAEAYLKQVEGMEWTIIRPAPIVDGKGGNPVATEDVSCYGTITRPDLASVVKKIIVSDKAKNKTLHVVDRTGLLIVSPYVRPLEFWEPLPFTEFEL
ncbi:NAD-dependent epimerase/dehydratase [Gracilaria domingensis]|nr:NAD-dependent epimerase/dehydratase [Gracilaria domingensis]